MNAMSQWQEYGYPGLIGVPFQTALHGLINALRERTQAELVSNLHLAGVLEIFDSPGAYPVCNVVTSIEDLFKRMSTFVLPDGNAFSLENAAAYLHEELVQLKGDPTASKWYCPPGTMFDWLTQRYRFLNLAYRVSTGWLYSNSIRERWYGQGKSFSEAVKNLTLDSLSDGEYTSFYGAVITTAGNGSQSVEKIINVPRRIRYPFAVPGLICLEIEPVMSSLWKGDLSWEKDAGEFIAYPQTDQCCKWQRDNMGLDMAFNTPQIFFTRQVSDEQEFCSIIELPELSDPVLDLFHNVPIVSPPGGYENSRLVRGFESPFRWFCDFRETLKFYDPAEPAA